MTRNEAYDTWQALEKQISALRKQNKSTGALEIQKEKFRREYFRLNKLFPTNPRTANSGLKKSMTNTYTDSILRCAFCKTELVDVDTIEFEGLLYCSVKCVPTKHAAERNNALLIKPEGVSLKLEGWDL